MIKYRIFLQSIDFLTIFYIIYSHIGNIVGSDIMITNTISRIDNDIIEVPLIIRDDYEDASKDWIPTLDIWPTKIDGDTSYIDCTQSFRPNLKDYKVTEIDPRIGRYDWDNLVIYWKALVNSDDLHIINKAYKGKLRACIWQRRYAVYFSTGSKVPWLHSVIFDCNEPDHVKHHINGVSVDDRRENLHILPKVEHDSINHPTLDIRKQMFADPKEYWERRKVLAVNEFIKELALIITFDGQANFIAKFAEENMALAKEILEAAKLYINLSSVKTRDSRNRTLNPHLRPNYLDAYEMEKYLRKNALKSKSTEEGQLKLL
jgi:hypothetical protein